ncbi:hypothetical protein [Synechococcus sp. BIOS-E4-1]|uniref:hypothetical protein n=1 Tax=Synechococcus sp. BIOS-E4-1 TaxID=1400864 RepID=UPI00210405C0|nr:hypothetical protein [Synechococcus sp. BIOS-E4-1]
MAAAVEQLNQQEPIELGDPVIAPGAYNNDLVVITCKQGQHGVIVDQPLACRVVLFDWTGQGIAQSDNPQNWQVISEKTECKGELMESAWHQLDMPPEDHYVAFLDDDLCLRTSDINTVMALSRMHHLSAAQPSLSLNSPTSQEYPWLRQRACTSLHRLPIVELQAPFIRKDLLDLSMPFLASTKSAYGYDRFALPLCAAEMQAWRFGAIDLAAMSHLRPLGSVNLKFSNGLTSKEEEYLVRLRLMTAMGFTVDEEIHQQLEHAVSMKK